MDNELCIIVPARSGSKGIVDKNINDLCGKSLLYRALESATKISDIKNICLSTDSEKYFKHISKQYSPIFLKRDLKLSGDKSLALDVWKDAIIYMNNNNNNIFEYSLFFEPTSPIRNIDWIKGIINQFKLSNDDLWMSIKETDSKYRIEKQFIINKKGQIKNLFSNSDIYSLRQNSTKTYHKDGVFYLAKSQYILSASNLLEGVIKGIVNKYKSVNIDTYEDLQYARYLLNNLN